MYSKVNYTIVGIFVLMFGVALVAFTFWIAKYGIQQEYKQYKIYMSESVSGLSKDSTVRLRGVNIGHVASIQITPKSVESVEIILNINSDIVLKEDMRAHTEMIGITGLLSIAIDGGTDASKDLLAQNGDIPVIKTSLSWFTKTSRGFGDLTENLSTVVKKLDILLSNENMEHFSAILKNSEEFSAHAVNVLNEFNSTIIVYKDAAKRLNESISSASNDFSLMTKNAIPSIKSVKLAADDFSNLSKDMKRSLYRGDYNLREIFYPMIVDIGILTEEMTDLSKDLHNNPSGILFNSRNKRGGPGE